MGRDTQITATIYALCDSREPDPVLRIRYIGQTRLPLSGRLHRHWITALAGAREHRAVWMRAMRRAGAEVLIVAVQEHVASTEADGAEMSHIARLRQLGCDLTNRTDGGKGHAGEVSAETRRKMSEAAKRRGPHPPDVYRRIGEILKNRPTHQRHMQRLHRLNSRPCPTERRRRISATLRGEGNGQNVLTWDAVDVIRARYASGVRQAQLVREFQVSPGTIHRVVHRNGWVRP